MGDSQDLSSTSTPEEVKTTRFETSSRINRIRHTYTYTSAVNYQWA